MGFQTPQYKLSKLLEDAGGGSVSAETLARRRYYYLHIERRESLVQLVETAMGKTAQPDVDQDDPSSGQDAPDAFALGIEDVADEAVP